MSGLKQQSLAGFFTATPAKNANGARSAPNSAPPANTKNAPKSASRSVSKHPQPLSSPIVKRENSNKSKKSSSTLKPPSSDLFRDPSDDDDEEDVNNKVLRASINGKRKSIIIDDDDDEVEVAPSSISNMPDSALKSKKPRMSSTNGHPETSPVPSSPLNMQTKRSRLKKAATKKSRKTDDEDDDDDFIVSDGHVDSDSADGELDDDLDLSLIDEDAIMKEQSKPKSNKPKASKSNSSSLKAFRPTLQKQSSGSSSPLSARDSFKTQAELRKESDKKKRAENEEVFEFLANLRDADGNKPGTPGYDPRTLYIPQKSFDKLTPFEKQFWDIKRNHFDTVLFFQKGKFYELYENDADIGHQEFDLKMTDRVKMRMVGVPEMQLEHWASMFLAKGYKVGRVDQSETAIGKDIRQKDAKKGGSTKSGPQIVHRELKSVLTTGTIVEGKMLRADDATYCFALKEYIADSSSPPRIGVCVIDTSTAEVELAQFVDDIPRTTLETVIRQKRPKELIHEKGNLSPATLRILRNTCPLDCQWTALKPGVEFLDHQDTLEELPKLFARCRTPSRAPSTSDDADMDEAALPPLPEPVIRMRDRGATESLSALGAMISYLRQLNLDKDIFTCGNFNVYDPLKHGTSLILDGQTLAHIEVLQNSLGGEDGTLLRLLSRCITPFGKRLFKTWLCQPLRDVDAINARLDAVEDLLKSTSFQHSFDSMTKGLPDLERLISRVHAKSLRPRDFLKVLSAFSKVSELRDKLSECSGEFKSSLFTSILKRLPECGEYIENVKAMFTVDEDELIPLDGADATFDSTVEKITSIEEELENCLQKYKKQLNCKTLEWKDIGTKEIYQVQVPRKVSVPNNWSRLSQTKDFHRYWSPEVEKLVKDLKEMRERRTTAVTEFKYKVFEKFDENYSVWLSAVRGISQIDCLLSLAKASASLGEPAVRPEIIDAPRAIVSFESLRHPCVISPSGEFIPNDISIGGDHKSTILLTGPNMAGKSTLLRMVSVGVIMAQLGCYVPATRACVAPVDKIHTRLGANDKIFASASTFMVEMQDASKILSEATPKSLVILDELGRGTATFDGMSIAYATLHHLATLSNCLTIFATHYNNLVRDFEYHQQVRPCHMLTQLDQTNDGDEDAKDVIFLYKLADGATTKSYGPKVAALAGVPKDLVRRATEVSAKFEHATKSREATKRTQEQLPLGLQADATWLIEQLSAKSLSTLQTDRDRTRLWSVATSFANIRKGILASK